MCIVGKTIDGKDVISGELVFNMVATHGLPLSMVVEFLFERNIAIDWLSFFDKTIAELWNPHTTLTRIREALVDSGYSDIADEIEYRLKYCIVKRAEKTK